MSREIGRDLMHRWERNPIITQLDVPYRCNTVFNGTPVKVNGTYYMIVRVEGLDGRSLFALARSGDGLHFEIEREPCMLPAEDGPFKVWEESGIEDPRLTLVEGTFYILYTAIGRYGHVIALAKTDDFHHYERIALVSEPGNKDGVLFPRTINGLYARLDRPIGRGVGSMWLSWSPDLINWGRSEFLVAPRSGYWDSFRIGASAPPIETDAGWLEIYHGVKMTSAGPIYRIGTIMLDLDDPTKIVGQCVEPSLSPREDYERIGDVGNVVFACGAIVEDDGHVKVYYGAADTSICVATVGMDDLIASCMNDDEV
ncbi:MAG: glycoside hydrolase family 130 protein [Planctomycetota bacterium]